MDLCSLYTVDVIGRNFIYSKTPIYRASRGKGFRPGISGGPVNRIVRYTKLHINLVFGGRGKAPVNRGTRYIGAR